MSDVRGKNIEEGDVLRGFMRRGGRLEEEMNQVLGRCPVCGEGLSVTRLECPNCDTALEGHFTLGRFHHLSPEQLRFVETFIKCEGKINRVEEELGISYPTVRSRLQEVIRALGYQVEEGPARPSSERRQEILEELSQGKIGAQEAAGLLRGE
jgi:hypothetical protein